MRVTTQMLNRAAAKTGLPFAPGNSLLNYVNQTKAGSENPLLAALGKNSGVTAAAGQKSSEIAALLRTQQKSGYKKLDAAADQLAQSVAALTAEGENSVFGKAEKTGDTGAVGKSVERLADSYNEMVRMLEKQSDPMNQYYGYMMREAAAENSQALKELGITIGKDGTLSVDKGALGEADVKELKEIFGSGSGFQSKLSFLASRVSGNAQANLQSASGRYNDAGTYYGSSGSRYDFWG